LAQWASVRVIKKLRSVDVSTAPGSGCQKGGQPVPLSYLVAEANNGSPQPAQRKVLARFSWLSGLVPARSVQERNDVHPNLLLERSCNGHAR
jgi:hypothetical protein